MNEIIQEGKRGRRRRQKGAIPPGIKEDIFCGKDSAESSCMPWITLLIGGYVQNDEPDKTRQFGSGRCCQNGLLQKPSFIC